MNDPRLHLPADYVSREDPAYYHDGPSDVTWQPEVYASAVRIARALQRDTLIDAGCGAACKSLASGLKVIGIDTGPNLARIAACDAVLIDHDLAGGLPRWDYPLARAVFVCADVIEHLVDPARLLWDLSFFARYAPVVISTPDRDLVRAPGDLGPPDNPSHVREWNQCEFVAMLRDFGFDAVVTHTIDNDRDRSPSTLLAVAGL